MIAKDLKDPSKISIIFGRWLRTCSHSTRIFNKIYFLLWIILHIHLSHINQPLICRSQILIPTLQLGPCFVWQDHSLQSGKVLGVTDADVCGRVDMDKIILHWQYKKCSWERLLWDKKLENQLNNRKPATKEPSY